MHDMHDRDPREVLSSLALDGRQRATAKTLVSPLGRDP
jgi:hypothetical protein